MTRDEAIATIEAALPKLSDEQAQQVADFAQALAAPALPRPLSARERALLAQSKRDFAEGRTLTMEELDERLDEFFARQRDMASSK